MARPRRTEEALSTIRQRLLDAAASEFAAQGYAGANVNHISQAAGFAKGTIYNYFPSKRALLLALIDQAAADHSDSVLQQMHSEQDPAGRLEHFFRAGFAFVEGHPAQARTIINAVYGPDTEFRERVYQAYERLFALISQDILMAGVAQGSFRSLDLDLTTALIMSIYLGSCSQTDAEGQVWLDPGQIARLILDGLRPREPREQA
jgi:AcrR family transcriptional regulator